MGNRCVVSFADGAGDYRKKMQRLEQSLKGNFDGDFLGFTSYAEIVCAPHSVIPYAFKQYSIKKAIELGYETILWADSPICAVKSLSGIFNHIEDAGYVIFDNIGHTIGMWTNDKALNHFGVTREQAMTMKMTMACCQGFYTKAKFSVRMALQEYIDLAHELNPGEWSGPQAHRHDQTLISLLAHKYGLEITNGQQTFFMYENHRFAVPINEETICLISK